MGSRGGFLPLKGFNLFGNLLLSWSALVFYQHINLSTLLQAWFNIAVVTPKFKIFFFWKFKFVPLFVSTETASPTARVCKSTATNLANVGSRRLKRREWEVRWCFWWRKVQLKWSKIIKNNLRLPLKVIKIGRGSSYWINVKGSFSLNVNFCIKRINSKHFIMVSTNVVNTPSSERGAHIINCISM